MPTYNAYAVSGIAPPSLRRRRRGVSSHPVLALGAQFPTGHSTTVGPTGARLRVRCWSARGSSGAPSETADFERSNGTGFESRPAESASDEICRKLRSAYRSKSRVEVFRTALESDGTLRPQYRR